MGFDVIINATPIGMAGNKTPLPIGPEDLVARYVFDLVYNPIDTPLLRMARQKGIAVISGVEMFVQQGARQFEIWTGKPAPSEEMLRVVLHSLRQGSDATEPTISPTLKTFAQHAAPAAAPEPPEPAPKPAPGSAARACREKNRSRPASTSTRQNGTGEGPGKGRSQKGGARESSSPCEERSRTQKGRRSRAKRSSRKRHRQKPPRKNPPRRSQPQRRPLPKSLSLKNPHQR